MKTLKTTILGLLVVLFVSPAIAQSYVNKSSNNSKISVLLEKSKTMISIKLWDLGEINGEDKIKVKFQAIEVGDNKVSDVTKGIKVTVIKEAEAQVSSLFNFDRLETYIDVDEYETILTSLNYMINTFNIWSNEKIDEGQIYYTTNDNFYFGFKQDGKKQLGIMKIIFERVEFSCELKKLDKALQEMKGFIETASKELYLDANLEKFEQAKKEEEERQKEAEKAKKEKEKMKNEDKKQQNEDEDQL